MVLFGCESWTLTKTDEGKLSKLERKALRKVYGPNCVNWVWRMKFDELCILYKEHKRDKNDYDSYIEMVRTHSEDGG